MPKKRAKQGAASALASDDVDRNHSDDARKLDTPNQKDSIDTRGRGIGSRLRKRRRTGSSAPVPLSPASKRQDRGHTDSPGTERPSIEAPPSKKSSKKESLPNGKRKSPFDPENTHEFLEGSPVHLQNQPSESRPEVVASSDPTSDASLQTNDRPLSTTAPDLAEVIKHIIDHGEHIDNLRDFDEMGLVDTDSLTTMGASLSLRTQSLPILENLATQILNTLAKSTYAEILTIVTDPDSESGQAYATLKSLFDHTKKVYSVAEPFLNPYDCGLVEQIHVDIIRKANLATFVSSVFGSQEVGFYHLNEYFLETFVADGNRLLKSQAQIFLDLKTQAYISASVNRDRSREELIEDLFPHDLEERLLSRRPGAKQLAPSEADFLQRSRNRAKSLIEEPDTAEAIAALPDKYVWEDFLREVSTYVSKNFEMIVGVPAVRKILKPRSVPTEQQDQQNRDHQVHIQQWQHYQPPLPQPQRPQQPSQHPQQPPQSQQPQQPQQAQQTRQPLQPQQPQQVQQVHQNGEHVTIQPTTEMKASSEQSHSDTDDIIAKAARAAQFAMQGFGINSDDASRSGQNFQKPPTPPPQEQQQQTPSQSQQPPPSVLPLHHQYQQQQQQQQFPIGRPPQQVQYQFAHSHQFAHPQAPPGYWHPHPSTNPEMAQHQHLYGDQAIPYPTQTAPTQILYERARMAASAKASPSNRRAGTPSQRRPWTTEEENALMAGLDRVKGPHWSQILAMFGPGGTINESLKDRNQVQLKDKARNLKLFFLKSGIEVPYYLQFVTGELKTRAPAQAAKNEEKARMQQTEDRGHVEAVMTLAGSTLQTGNSEISEANDEATMTNGDSSHGHPKASDGQANGMNVGGGIQLSETKPSTEELFAAQGQASSVVTASAQHRHLDGPRADVPARTNTVDDADRALSAALQAQAATESATASGLRQELTAS